MLLLVAIVYIPNSLREMILLPKISLCSMASLQLHGANSNEIIALCKCVLHCFLSLHLVSTFYLLCTRLVGRGERGRDTEIYFEMHQTEMRPTMQLNLAHKQFEMIY